MITVIVPVYKVEPYLPKCLDSILAQSFRELEIILVDDGSPDRCGEICDRYAAEDARIRVIHKENQGQSIARNTALELAHGDYVTFVDSDDWIEPWAYEKMLALAEKTGARIVCAGRYNVKEDSGERTLGLCPEKEEVVPAEEMLRRMFTWQNCDSSPCDKLFDRSLFREIRFPEKSGCEDIAILYRLVLLAGETAMLPMAFYNYLQRKNSTSYGRVTERIFNWPQQVAVLYAYIREHVPSAEPAARYQYLWYVSHTLILLDQADPETRSRYAGQMKDLRRKLRGQMGFLLSSPYFGKQERLRDLLVAFDWYRGLRRLRHPG